MTTVNGGPLAIGSLVVRPLDDDLECWIVEHADGSPVVVNGEPVHFDDVEDALRWAQQNRGTS